MTFKQKKIKEEIHIHSKIPGVLYICISRILSTILDLKSSQLSADVFMF